MKILDLNQIRPSNKEDLQDVIRELDETKALCRQLNMIIEEAPDGIYVTDGEANAIRINPAFERISGLDRKEMLGVNHKTLEETGVVARSSALMALDQQKEVTIIHEYLKSGLEALVTSKPVFNEDNDVQMIVSSIRDATELSGLKNELEKERERRQKTENKAKLMQERILDSSEIIANDKKMKDLIETAKRIAKVDSTVLITGETGTGKEEIAKIVHNNSLRQEESYIPINCGAIPENLVESELFGYEGGAFTGARKSGKPGVFELADKGTVFLDEVGELALDVQAKLLRAMENGVITRIGGIKPIKVDVRIVAATNRDLKNMVKSGSFRRDLYYRLNVVPLHIPALRERRNDIIPLTEYFLSSVNKKYGMQKKMTNEAYHAMTQYDWPGNVRELKNLVESLAVMTDKDIIEMQDIMYVSVYNIPDRLMDKNVSVKEKLERIEYVFISEAYEEYKNVRDAAKAIDMPVSTFARKKREYELKFGDSGTHVRL